VLPVELLVGAPEEAALAEDMPLAFRHEGDVRRRGFAQPGKLDEALGERGLDLVAARSRGGEEPPSGRRRERPGDLQLRVIVAAGALIGLGPAAVEDIFAARMGLEVAGHDAEHMAVLIFRDEMLRLPAGARHGRAGDFERREEVVRYERVV